MESFLENCGVRSLQVGVEGDAAPAARPASRQPYLLLGRDERSDVRLDGDKRVSRRHAYLQAVGGRVSCVDLNSRTGVHWPSGPRPLGWVEWDEPLRVGGSVVRVSQPPADGDASFPSEADSAGPRPAAPAFFEVTGGPGGPVRWRMRRLLSLVGGAALCKVRLCDPGVSRFHCSLVRGPLGVWVVDLLSRTGTRLNGQPVAWARLEDGDRLEVGPYVLRVRYEAAGEARNMQLVPVKPASRAVVAAPASFSTHAGVDRSLLLPVINEFHVMQEQMMDQFHQSMLMMAELFTTLHREQAGLVREELDHLRRLTRELNSLHAERARTTAPDPAPAAQAAAADGDTDRVARREEEDVREAEARRKVDAPAADGAAERPREAGRKVPQAAGPANSPAEVHDWLTRRIDALQAERQGRWQKLMQLVMGR